MSREFDTVLDRCLEMLERGSSVEECLRAFPQHTANLRPLLAAAHRVRGLEVPPPSPEAVARGEQALRETMEREPARSARRFLSRPLVPVAAAAVVAALALVALAVAGPLRGAFDLGTETATADGTVMAVAADTLWINTEDGTTTVLIDKDTWIEDRQGSRVDLRIIAPGAEVRVRGEVDDEGSITAERIEVRIEPEERDGAPGQPGLEGEELEFEGQVVTVAGGTVTMTTPAGTVSVVIVLDTEVDGQIQPGVLVKVHGTQQADGSILAREIDVLAPGVAVEDRLPGELEFEGQVAAVAAGMLTVTTAAGTFTVVIGLDTEVDGQIERGVLVKVHGTQQADGSILAREIDLLAPGVAVEDRLPGDLEFEGEELEFEGQVAAVAGGTLTVTTPAGTFTVVIGLDTEVDGQIERGVTIKVHGAQQADGSILAREIDVLAPGVAVEDRMPGELEFEGEELEFEGQVAAVAGGTLTVTTPAGTFTVVIGLDTEVDGQIEPGVMIKVHGAQQADGSVLAREIDVLAPGVDEDGRGENGGDGGGDEDDGDDHSGPGGSNSGPGSGG